MLHYCWVHGTVIIFTGGNEVVAKVMFLQASVILSTGGVSASVHVGIPHTPTSLEQTPPGSRHPPQEQIPPPPSPRADTPGSRPPPGADTTPPPRTRLRHTVNERPVRILLECILVNVTCLIFDVRIKNNDG